MHRTYRGQITIFATLCLILAPVARPAPATTQPGAILPEDLRPSEPTDYRLVPGDVLSLSGWDESGKASDWNRTLRVSETGNVTVPPIDTPFHFAGMTEDEARRAVQKAYREAKLSWSNVSLVITEAHGELFKVFGDGVTPAWYALTSNEIPLTFALATGGATQLPGHIARVLRHAEPGHAARVVDVSLDKLLAGDPTSNVWIRPGDSVVLMPASDAATKPLVQVGPGPDVVKAEDLDAGPPTDYRIGPSDLLEIILTEVRPGVETTTTVRVRTTGNIDLPSPFPKPLHAAGLTETALRKAILEGYRSAGVPRNVDASVNVTAALGSSFNVLGAVRHPGNYYLGRPDFRLLDALTLGQGADAGATTARLIRRTTDATQPARVIDIPLDQLLAGAARTNIVIRPGDTLVLLAAPATR